MEKNENFLETGSYNGHYYGTPKPLLSDLIMRDDPKEISTEDENPGLETRTEDNSESNERVTVHRESENLNEESLNKNMKKENGLKEGLENNRENDHLRKGKSLQNQPIIV